jgi:cell division protein FtsI (penicillin-binding protein 3)
VSSNIGTSRIFDALGGDHLARTLQRFHFASAPARIVSGTFEGVNVAIGEGLTATPLEVIAAYGALAGDGIYHAPTSDRGGSPGERVISSETARAVMALLETAMADPAATGKAARVPGVRVAGKTGTAEWTAPDGRKRTYASFVGVADLPTGRVVALVGIEAARDDMSGGSAAAPVFARLVGHLLAK